MESRQTHALPPNPSLPPRPNLTFTQPTPGPSRPTTKRPHPQAQRNAQPSASMYSAYQPPNVQYPPQMPFSPYVPNLSGGYQLPYPSYAYPYPGHIPSFGQALFQPNISGGYGYSPSFYQQPQAAVVPNRPAKRPRNDTIPYTITANSASPPAAAGSSGNWPGAWRNCSHPGCKFTGPGDKVSIHEGDRHLIFPNGKPVERSEEEEQYAGYNGPPPPIPGTNIRLQTEEDIAKWIAERRARWPSSKRIAEKEAERNAAISRGENPSKGKGRGHGRGGFSGNGGGRRSDPASLAEDWGRPEPDIPEGEKRSTGSGRGGIGERGRGRGRGRGRERGRGAARGKGGPSRGGGDRKKDDGWGNTDLINKPPQIMVQTETNEATANPALNALKGLGDYESASDVEDESDSSDSESGSDDSSSISSTESSETETSSHLGDIVKLATELLDVEPVIAENESQDIVKSSVPVCRYFAKSGKCRKGQKCPFAHQIIDTVVTSTDTPHRRPEQSVKRKPPRQPAAKKANPFERPSMLGSLLANPIQNTLSQLSQTIRFLVANDMLRGVELQVGEAEERERERNKVIMLDDVVDLGPVDTADQLVEPGEEGQISKEEGAAL